WPLPVARRQAPLTTLICQSAKYQPLPVRCTAVRHGRLRSSRRMGLRRRVHFRDAFSIRSEGFSGDAKFWSPPSAPPKQNSAANRRRAACEGPSQDYTENQDCLATSRPLRRRFWRRRCRVFFSLCHSEWLNGPGSVVERLFASGKVY